MKFTLVKNLSQDPLMRPILLGLLLCIALYLVVDLVVKHYGFGISPSAVNLTIFGNEDEYIDAISRTSFLEFWHMEIFFIMIILLTLCAVFIRLSGGRKRDKIIMNIMLLSALSSLVFLALGYFVSGHFIEAYSVLFIVWHLTAFYMVVFSIRNLYRA